MLDPVYAYFRTEPLAPGKYKTNLGYREVTSDHLKTIRKNTNRMIGSGVIPKILVKHDDSKNGDPAEDPSALEAEGDVTKVTMTRDGRISFIFRVPEGTEVCKRIRDRRISATSPSFIEYEDGKCRKWGMVARHLALTPAPLNVDQPPISEVSSSNFAEMRLGPISFSEYKRKDAMPIGDTTTPGQNTQTQTPANNPAEPIKDPKTVADTEIIDERQVAELLSANDISAPSVSMVTNFKEWVEQLVSALQNKAAKRAASPHTSTAAAVAAREEPDVALAYNFAEHADPAVRKMYEDHKALVDRHSKQLHETNLAGIKERLSKPWIPETVRSSLSNRLGAVNFSEGADGAVVESPSLTVTEALDLVEKSIPEAARVGQDDVLQEEHPSGEGFYKTSLEDGEKVVSTIEEADKIVDAEHAGFALNIG